MKSMISFLLVTSFLGSVTAAHAQMKMMSDSELMADERRRASERSGTCDHFEHGR